MSVEGPLGAYVNPGGHVHEMLTVAQTRGLRLIGRPTVENSWFDGLDPLQSILIIFYKLQYLLSHTLAFFTFLIFCLLDLLS